MADKRFISVFFAKADLTENEGVMDISELVLSAKTEKCSTKEI
jgi:hypothetical protein